MNVWFAIKRFLRSRAAILGELSLLTVACTLGAIAPSLGIFQSLGFGALCLLVAVSLGVATVSQARRRPALAVMHLGILLLILAGIVRVLFATEGRVDLIEGETLPAGPAAWTPVSRGRLAGPFHLEQPLTLESVHGRRYPTGELQDLTARLSVGEIAVNRQLRLGGKRLFLTQEFGPALLIEWSSAVRAAILLDSATRTGTADSPAGLTAHFRAGTARPEAVEARIMRGPGLLFAGDVRIGQTITLAGGETLTLRGVPMWARLHGSRDPSILCMYLGFAILLLGCVMQFGRGPRLPLLLMLAAGVPACDRAGTDDARRLVLEYNRIVCEAYRRGDPALVDAVTGTNESRRLSALIGVRLDMGLTLDATLLNLDVVDTRTVRGELQVRTHESWHYCDRRIGTGEKVGEASQDDYDMLYRFVKLNGMWRVDEIRFASAPRVGRTATTWLIERPVTQTLDRLPHSEGKHP